jgi:hypothetical protein
MFFSQFVLLFIKYLCRTLVGTEMTTKEKMQALLNGETLVSGITEIQLTSSGGMMCENCYPRDFFDNGFEWQIKSKTKELSADDVRNAWERVAKEYTYLPLVNTKVFAALIKELGL